MVNRLKSAVAYIHDGLGASLLVKLGQRYLDINDLTAARPLCDTFRPRSCVDPHPRSSAAMAASLPFDLTVRDEHGAARDLVSVYPPPLGLDP